jgi:translation initiation factor IF-2
LNQANPKAPASGVVLESKQEVGLGAVATVLIQRGTLKPGDDFIAGGCAGKVG